MPLAFSIPTAISDGAKIIFPTAVATASDKVALRARMTTASAFPKLSECPTVPEEVLMPNGVLRAAISIPIFPLNGERPAKMPSRRSYGF